MDINSEAAKTIVAKGQQISASRTETGSVVYRLLYRGEVYDAHTATATAPAKIEHVASIDAVELDEVPYECSSGEGSGDTWPAQDWERE